MSLLKQIFRAPVSAKFGLLVIVLYILVALFAPVLAPYGETQVVGEGFAPWSSQFLLGTDNLGRAPQRLINLREDISHYVLPARRPRSYRREVKIKMSNYPRKRPAPPSRKRAK